MKLLKDLLVDSYSGDYRKVINVITKFLEENTDAKIVEQKISEKKSNLIAIFGKPDLLINCHMDTVPPSGEWKYCPTELTEDSGKLYGLGTADTKGNIYCVLNAVEKIKPKNLMLLFTVDEECGKIDSGVTYFLNSEHKQGIKKAIVCEPTSLKIVNKHKGYYSFVVKVKSKPIHSSKKGDNAITKASKLVLEFDKLGFNIGKIFGGIQGNIVASKCEFKVSIRTYEDKETVLNKINKVIEGIDGVETDICFVGLPLENKTEFKTECYEADFWTEASLLYKAGINTVVFGAGSIEQAHCNDEFVSKEELEKAQLMFEKLIGDFK